MILLAEVIDFQRFRRPRELMAYLGLVELDAGHHCMGAGIEGIVLEERDHPTGQHAGGHRPEEVGAGDRRDVVDDPVKVNQVCRPGSSSFKPSEQLEAYPVRGVAAKARSTQRGDSRSLRRTRSR